MTDEGRQKLCERLRKNGFDMDAEEQAADEIERLANELRLAISARDSANDLLLQVRERLEQRISELERKAPW